MVDVEQLLSGPLRDDPVTVLRLLRIAATSDRTGATTTSISDVPDRLLDLGMVLPAADGTARLNFLLTPARPATTSAQRMRKLRAERKKEESKSGASLCVTVRHPRPPPSPPPLIEDKSSTPPSLSPPTPGVVKRDAPETEESRNGECVCDLLGDPLPGLEPALEVQQVVDAYNEILGHALPQALKVTDKRRRSINARSKDLDDIESWKNYFRLVARIPFLLGSNDRGWRADLDWITSETHMSQIIEGRYGD